MEIKLKVEADELVTAINNLATAIGKAELFPKIDVPATEPKPETQPQENDPPKPEPEPEPVPVTELRAKAAEKAKEGKKDEIKALLSEFGAKTVSSVDEEKRSEFLERLAQL